MTIIKKLANLTPYEKRAVYRLNHGRKGKMLEDLMKFFQAEKPIRVCSRCGWLLSRQDLQDGDCPECRVTLTHGRPLLYTGREHWVILKKNQGGRVLGWAFLQHIKDSYNCGLGGPFAEVQVYVSPRHRHKGIGTRVMESAKALANRLGLPPKVYHSNASVFFDSLGFDQDADTVP